MRRILVVSIACLLLFGCGTKRPIGVVSGTITYKGQAVNGATLSFDPVGDTKGVPFFVPVGQDGSFRTSDVPLGEYRITVEGSTGTAGMPNTTKMDPSKLTPAMKEKLDTMKTTPTIPFPAKYKKGSLTSDLTCKIVPGDNTLKLELKD